ncbi:MAG: nicotinate (nicotinamide) nucleotide adenylyltransferase [Candidatus Eremiobacteraeota bacterium]|nr:nicotinate (nicotinamide) nucleotide adenylyltransferase [Candidatus Eremiobacteraeota bacterium]MBV8263622.1 nicotinate (nicotinamide) nucleotide adenylyltransferase [Candidatus Eremiobacteraeota bacterium]MBV8460928.1 nicotinate (nicotinamide) nucleotide adenylyltransferase [Candidatus Eremiobacteraeota bacterium]MBV8669670.1 nicotinate (nicotinamide) nucleotide adenylyltransferase [Candidatus Eremiobacteraeota bacterium]MBV8671286.1 nicotinate (nicotinamide) nucleotide adenylyltransferase
MSRPLRLGILGGAFDPVHVGHLFIASAVAAELGLDRVLFQPVGDPAHRTPVASSADRRAMVLLAIRSDDRFVLDETALRQRGPVYTADTMPLLRKAYPDASFLFIAGADSLIDTPWRRLDEVAAELDHFVVVERAGADARRLEPTLAALPSDLARRFMIVNLPLVDVSASAIRARVAAHQPIRYLVPDPVADYIARAHLYEKP